MYIYAHINKNTLRFVREQKAISFDYVTRITKFKEDKLTLWESNDSGKFPTINQAKTIAKCYRIPFAGLYMNAQDINIKHLPKMRNLRSLPNAIFDNSALNLAIADVLSARELLLESKKALKETVVQFNMSINCPDDNVAQWAGEIRRTLGIDSNVQYKCRSARQFYLYIRNLAEAAGAFVHCFTGVDTEIVRGFAIYEDLMPIIGLNNDDRYPAKTFSIIYELVHLIKRSSAVCNDMTNSLSLQAEEVFCNAVAGAVLVPTVNLSRQLGEFTHKGDIVVMDNMRSHHVKEVAETLHAAGIELRYLPPYSPDMNPIEMLWSKVKALLRKWECRTAELLPKTVSCALLCVSQRDCVGWFKADGYCL